MSVLDNNGQIMLYRTGVPESVIFVVWGPCWKEK